MQGSITRNPESTGVTWYQCEACAKFHKLPEPLADGVKAYTICGCPAGKRRMLADNPVCRHCGQKLAYLGEHCGCPEAVALREQDAKDTAEREEIRRQQAQEQQEKRDAERTARDLQDNDGLAILRRESAREQATAARASARDAGWQDVLDQRLALAQEDIAERKRAKDDTADTPPVGLTLADFEQEVSLLDVERLPSAFERTDGATLLYEGRFNTIYGEAAIGKTWTAQIVVIQQLRAGRRVIWWDSEDRASTLAKRLQLLRATDLIGAPNLKWITGDVQANPSALAEALEFLDGGNGPGLVVIDSATSFGCPSDGADVAAWLNAFINPWWNAGHTVLLLDHVPKQKKDRPRGGIGSQAKLARIDGAAIYAHGIPWNAQQGGYIHLTVHKDRQGQLPAILNGTAATITGDWDGPTLDWSVDLPNAKDEGEDLQIELMDALEGAGAEGVKGSRALRELLKGKRAKDIDAAREELLQAGMIERVKDGRGYVYTISR